MKEKSERFDEKGRELCGVCIHWRTRHCSRVNCGVRHDVTAAPREDTYPIGEGCSVTQRHTGAE